MDVSVIIVNFNTCELTVNCIESVFKETYDISFELIVVDNASVDGSLEVLRNERRIKLIENNSNIGFGRANNLGLKEANGRNILFLNSDTILITNAIKILSEYLDLHNKVGACGGNLFDEHNLPARSFGRFFPGYEAHFHYLTHNKFIRVLYGNNLFFNHSKIPIKVGYVSGANMMVKKKIINEIGGAFDESFFLYFEETEFSFRIKKAGYKIMNIPSAKIVHLEGKSSTDSLEKWETYFISEQIFFNKVYSASKANILNILFFTYHKLYIILGRILGKNELVLDHQKKVSLVKDSIKKSRQ